MGKHTIDLTDADFEEKVLGADRAVLVDFWAPWCGPCKKVGPVLEEIAAAKADSLIVAKVNVDDHPALAQHYKIMGIPAMLLFKEGKLVKEIVGARPKAALLDEIEGSL